MGVLRHEANNLLGRQASTKARVETGGAHQKPQSSLTSEAFFYNSTRHPGSGLVQDLGDMEDDHAEQDVEDSQRASQPHVTTTCYKVTDRHEPTRLQESLSRVVLCNCH